MPETYTFTARATAASGAFADRNFSISVSNTQIQRLLAVGPTGAARMLNANSLGWTLIPGVKGDSAHYGDRWLVWDQTAGMMRLSPDLINWTSFVPTLPAGYTGLRFLRWRAGAWWAMGIADRTSHWEFGAVTSTDGGLHWVLAGATISSASIPLSFERSEAGASIIATTSEWFYRGSDGDAWLTVRTVTMGAHFQIAYLNGMWFAPAAEASARGLAHSTDGSTWFDQSNPSVLTSGYYRGIAWGNGYVIAHAYSDALAGSTLDAGLTVQASIALPTLSTVYDTECPIVCQQGRFVMLGDGGRTFQSNTPATAWSALSLPPDLAPTCLAVRN